MRRLLVALLLALLPSGAGAASLGSSGGSTGPQGPPGDTYDRVFDIKGAPFNAVGDGVTDDSAAFAAAQDSLEAGPGVKLILNGGIYYLPDFTWDLSEVQGCTIEGTGNPYTPADTLGAWGTILHFTRTASGDTTASCIQLGKEADGVFRQGNILRGFSVKVDRSGGFSTGHVLAEVNTQYNAIEDVTLHARELSGPDRTYAVHYVSTYGSSASEGTQKNYYHRMRIYTGKDDPGIQSYGTLVYAPDWSGARGQYVNALMWVSCDWQNSKNPGGYAIKFHGDGSPCNSHEILGGQIDGNLGIELHNSFNNNAFGVTIDLASASSDTAVYNHSDGSAHPTTGYETQGSSTFWGGIQQGLIVEDTDRSAEKRLQFFNTDNRRGPVVRSLSLQDKSSISGILASESWDDLTGIQSLAGRLVTIGSAGTDIDTLSVMGDPAAPSRVIDITLPPYEAVWSDSLTNSTTIKTAIEALDGQGSIYIPGGPLFVVGVPGEPDINLRPGITIFSDGPTAGGLRLATNSTKRGILRVSADSSVVIRDMMLDGSYATKETLNNDNGRAFGVVVNPSTDINTVTIERCYIRDVTVGVFVSVGGAICDFTVADNTFELQTRAYQNTQASPKFITTSAVYVENQSSCGLWITDNYITGGHPSASADSSSPAIYVDSPNAFIQDNWIVNWGHGGDTADSVGIAIQTGPNASSYTISGNDISSTYGPAIVMAGTNGEVRSGRADDIKRSPVVRLETGATDMVVDPSFRATNCDSNKVGGPAFPSGLADGHLFSGGSSGDGLPLWAADTLFYTYGGSLGKVSP